MQYPHVTAGERFRPSAARENAMIDAANAHLRTARSVMPGQSLPPLAPGQVYVKNTTGATRKRYDVLVASALSTATLAKSNRLESAHNIRTEPVVLGISPDPEVPAHQGRILVLDAPALNNSIVPAWASGHCVARIDYTADAGEAADIASGHKLENVTSGPCRIIALGADNDERLALIDLSWFGPPTLFVAELKAGWSDSRADCKIFRLNGANPISYTGTDAYVNDPLEAFSVLGVGDKMYCTKQGGQFYAVNNARCPL